jgi:tetratricopeptide (TPR) repeat protein
MVKAGASRRLGTLVAAGGSMMPPTVDRRKNTTDNRRNTMRLNPSFGFVIALYAATIYGQETTVPTADAVKQVDELLKACVEAGAVVASKPETAAGIGKLVDEEKLAAAVRGHRNVLSADVRNALLTRARDASNLDVPVLAALTKAVGKETSDALTTAVGSYSAGRVAEQSQKYPAAVDDYTAAIEHFTALNEPSWEAAALHRRGTTHYLRGEAAAGLKDLELALGLRQILYGAEHAGVADTLNNIGLVESRLGHVDRALTAQLRALEIRRKVHGAVHATVLQSLSNLAGVYVEIKQYDRALECRTEAWEANKKLFGKTNASTLLARREMAISFENLHDYAQAEAIYREVATARAHALGVADKSTIAALKDLGGVLYTQSKYDLALEQYREALARAERVPDGRRLSAELSRAIGSTYYLMDRLPQALAAHLKSLELWKQVEGADDEQALAHSWLGDVYSDQGEFELAEAAYRTSLAMRIKLFGQRHVDVAKSYYGLGILFRRKKDYRRAIEHYGIALDQRRELLGERHLDTASTMHWIGNSHYHLREYQKTIEFYEKALAIRRELAGGESPPVALSLSYLGDVYRARREFVPARKTYEQALAIRGKIFGKASADYAQSLTDLAYLSDDEMDFEGARKMHERCWEIRKAVFGTQSLQAANSLADVAQMYARIGEYEKSLQLLTEVLEIYQSLFGDKHPKLAWTLENMDYSHFWLGDAQRAAEFFRRGLEIRKATLSADDPMIADVELRLATCYAGIGRTKEAIDILIHRIRTLDKDKYPNQAIELLCLRGSIWFGLDMWGSARSDYQAALELSEQVRGADHPSTALCRFGIGHSYEEESQYANALPYLEQALAGFEKGYSPQNPHIPTTLFSMAVCEANLGNYRKSLELCDRALAQLQTTSYDDRARRGEWRFETLRPLPLTVRLLRYRGWDLEHLLKAGHGPEELQECVEAYRMASALQARVRESMKGEDSRLELNAGLRHLLLGQLRTYERLFALDKKPEHLQAAFTAIEQGTARVFLESLGRSRAGLVGGVTAERIAAEQKLLAELKHADRELEHLRNQPLDQRAPDQIEKATRSRVGLEARFAEFTAQSEKDYPQYFQVKYPRACSLAEAAACLEEDEVGLVYILGFEESYLLLIEPSPNRANAEIKLALLRLPDEKSISELVEVLLTDHSLSLPSGHGSVREEAWQVLLGPVADRIRGKKLVIVPTGSLTVLPFELLTAPTNDVPRFLIQDTRIRYAPSFTALHLNRRWQQARLRPNKAFTAIGDPIYDAADDRRAKKRAVAASPLETSPDASKNVDAVGGPNFVRLPFSAEEVRKIAGVLGNYDSRLLIGPEASEAAVKNLSLDGRLSQSQYVHFATHGVGGLRQSLVLNLVDNTDQDGYLELGEVMNLKLNADVVVLSACNSGRGRLLNSEGMHGLARGFLYAGSRGVICSLWQVDDRATSEIMVSAYRSLVDGRGTADALRAAKLERIANGEPPIFWAPFVIIGD